MIASLPMYDRPELRAQTDRFWSAIREAANDGPVTLNREAEPWDTWLSSDLFFSQTCGLPYRSRLHGKVRLVATPDYGLEACPPGYYRSVIVVRTDDPANHVSRLAGRRMAVNDGLSQSGWAAPLCHLRDTGTAPGSTLITGSHAGSALAVAEGRADFAGLDALTWEFLKRYEPSAAQLRILDATTPTPALPYITAWERDAVGLANALETAVESLSPEDRAALHIRGIQRIPAEVYLAVPTPPTA